MKNGFTLLFVVLICCFASLGFSQQTDSTVSSVPGDTLIIKPAYKPVIGMGRGIFAFYGDVKSNYSGNQFIGRTGTNINVSRKINDFLELNFCLVHGKLTGNERTLTRNLNFQTEIIQGGLNVSYNFHHLIKKPQRATPFISLGIETFEFNSKGDLYDADGNMYYYWSDGSIRNIDESLGGEYTSIILERDYIYETDLRKMDFDDVGMYTQMAFGIPVGIGVNIDIIDRVSMRLGSTYHYTFNDNIDNISSAGTGIRQGNKASDKFLYSYVSFHFDLFNSSSKSPFEDSFNDVDFASIYTDDEDKDGVDDWSDECPFTPDGVKIDNKGCPLDSDKDGVPDYLDKEANTTKQYANSDGVGMTADELAALMCDSVSLSSEDLSKYFPDMFSGVKGFKTYYLEIPPKFKLFDTNKDEFISVDELINALDAYFDFKSDFTLEDIYQLQDFFFDQ